MFTELKYNLITLRNWALLNWKRHRINSQYQSLKNRSNSTICRLDQSTIPNKKNEIRLFAIMRNESLRLPYFINYYKNLQVDRFFLLDNASTDQSVELALAEKNVHVFSTGDAYRNHWYWMEHLLETYGKNHWCVVVDIDELLSFPNAENLSIRDMCQFLEQTESTALRALLLDLYSDQAIRDISYQPGQNPLEVVPYFDTSHYEVTFPYFDRKNWKTFDSTHYTGGMRERIFGKSTPITSLNKFPLFQNSSGTYLGQGMHAINGAWVSDLQGVVFHTKFLQDFIQEAEEESIREQHFNKASYYKDFNRKLTQTPDLCLANQDSVRFQDSAQLVELGLMKTNPQFEKFAREKKRIHSLDVL
ncbi:glycosyltransferase family 2 protein [Larkinella sp. VNQ87]|uniref:glycosyltransferase family 2 protein n=1 Tax=Larkinella sp. VNQ87 TaxID=3400921 RepID=UPI003C0B8FF3